MRLQLSNIAKVYLVILICSHVDIAAQKLYLKKDLQIDYLALEIEFNEDGFTYYQQQMLKSKIEEAIADHNASNPKFNVYLVPNLEPDMTGFRMNVNELILPDKRSQHTAFYLSLLGLVVTPAALIASEAGIIFAFWFTTHNKIPHNTYLSTSLSDRSGDPLKYQIRSNGGWFKKPKVNEESIIEKFDYKFRRLLDRIHSLYRVPKDRRKQPALAFNLPTTFDKIFDYDTDMIEKAETQIADAMTDSSYVRKSRKSSWWSFDVEAGMSFPGASDISTSFTPMFSMGLGPKWKIAEDFRLKPFVSMDMMIKNHNSHHAIGETWMNFRFGGQVEYTIFPSSSASFNVYPLLNVAYTTGIYDFTNLNLDDPNNGVTALRHNGLTFGAGAGMAVDWFTCTLYYNFYNPKFRYVSGPTYGKSFDERLNMSTFSIQLGASIW